jgi:hypothetical protein
MLGSPVAVKSAGKSRSRANRGCNATGSVPVSTGNPLPVRNALCSREGEAERLSGFSMAEEKDKAPTGSRMKDLRQDRLKLALRENLKRRKEQARARSKTRETPSAGHEASPHGQLGKRDD